MYEKKFISQGGKAEWLNGLEHIPSKLRAIYDINKILAHRPWLLRKEHIEVSWNHADEGMPRNNSQCNFIVILPKGLTKGKNSWSLSEVVHAMVLLSHFHSLSSFVFSCGLTQKLDGLSSPKLKTAPALLPATQQQLSTNQPLPPLQQQIPQQQKAVLSEITMNNNNNVLDHSNHQLYNNNVQNIGGSASMPTDISIYGANSNGVAKHTRKHK